jgi:hypothetical protein
MQDCAELGIPGAKCAVGFYGFWLDCRKEALAAIAEATTKYPNYGVSCQFTTEYSKNTY